jgi:hypothetical protein
MEHVNRLTVATRQAAGRVHTTTTGICRCGPCRHQIAGVARRHGVTAEALTAQLAASRPPVPAAPARRTPSRPLTAAVGVSATVTVNGTRVSVAEGLLALAGSSVLQANRK